MNVKTLILVFFLTFVCNISKAQVSTYTFIDPCTKEVTVFSVPIQGGKTMIIFLNNVGSFDANDLSNGTFSNWVNQVYTTYRQTNPCSQQQGQVTQNQITAQIIGGTVQSVVSSILSSSQSQSSSSESGSSSSDAGGKDNKNSDKKKNNNSSQGNGNNTSQSNTSNSGSNQNGGQSQSNSGTNNSNGGSGSSQGNGNSTSGGNSSGSNNPTQGGNSTSQPSVGSGNSTSGNSSNGGGGSTGSGTSGSNGGNSTGGSSSGSNGGGSTGGSSSGSNGGGSTGGNNTGGSSSGNSGNNGGGSTGSGTSGNGGSSSTGGNNTGNSTNTTNQNGEEVGATTQMNNDAHNDNNAGGSNGGGKGKSGGGNARSNPIIVSSDVTSAQNLNRTFTPIVNIGTSKSSMTGLSSYGVTGMVWLNFKQFAVSTKYTKIHYNKTKKLKFIHNINLTGVYTYGNYLGFIGYSGILNGGKYGITGFNVSAAATIISEEKNGYYSPSMTAFYTRPFKVGKKLIVSPELYVISTPLVYSSKEKVSITDRYVSGFIGSGFDYQISKRFKLNVNYKANMSTNPEFPILSFFLVGSKINL
jgi:hypothetical protein